MLAPVRTVAPVGVVVTLAEAKRHLGVDFADHDAMIEGFVGAAAQLLDGWSGILGRCLLTQTWRQDFDGFGCDAIRLPLGPNVVVTSVTYRDVVDEAQALPGETWAGPYLDAIGAYIKLAYGQAWPPTYCRDDAVSVTFTAGYGADGSAVPLPIRQAILLLVGHWYENREAVNIGNITTALPFAVDALLAPYRRIGI